MTALRAPESNVTARADGCINVPNPLGYGTGNVRKRLMAWWATIVCVCLRQSLTFNGRMMRQQSQGTHAGYTSAGGLDQRRESWADNHPSTYAGHCSLAQAVVPPVVVVQDRTAAAAHNR